MKNVKLWIALCVVILIVGIIGSVLVLSPREGILVEIIQDGTVLHQIDLTQAVGQTIDIEYGRHINTVQVDENGIRIIHADCPDQTCVQMGYLEANGLPIVCLPNHLMIRYIDASRDTDVVTR